MIFVVLLSQVASGKQVSYFALLATLHFLLVIKIISKPKASRLGLVITFIAVLYTAFQVRPAVTFSGSNVIDLIYFAPICLVFFCGSLPIAIQREALYRGLVSISVAFLFLIICFHFFSFFPAFILAEPYAGTRWVGGFDGPNEFAQFYVLVFAVAIGLHREGELNTVLLLIMCSILLMAIWFSYSRGALLSLAIVCVAYILISLRFWVAVRLAAVFGLMSLLMNFYLLSLFEQFNDVRRNASDRYHLISDAIDIFIESPLAGVGFGGFAEFSTVSNSTPHSDFLYFLVSGGVVGVLGLSAFLCFVLLKSKSRKYYPEFLFFVAFFANGLTFNNLVRGRLSILFFLVLLVLLWRVNGSQILSDCRRTRRFAVSNRG